MQKQVITERTPDGRIAKRGSGKPPLTVLERFLSHVEVQTGGCWLWTSAIHKKGYGQFGVGDHTYQAHRWSYEYFIGPIPQGLQLDHLCRNRACVHPEHVEPVTSRVNGHRGLRGILNQHRTSEYIGVSWEPRRKKWRAHITIDGRMHHLGYFDLKEDAHQAYLHACASRI